MEGTAKLAEGKHTEMVVAGDWEEGGHPEDEDLEGRWFTHLQDGERRATWLWGRRMGSEVWEHLGHEILRAKHLEKRGSEGVYLFTESETGEGLSSCLSSILSSLLL